MTDIIHFMECIYFPWEPTPMIPISNQFVTQNNKALIVASLLIVTLRELQINNLFLTFSVNTRYNYAF